MRPVVGRLATLRFAIGAEPVASPGRKSYLRRSGQKAFVRIACTAAHDNSGTTASTLHGASSYRTPSNSSKAGVIPAHHLVLRFVRCPSWPAAQLVMISTGIRNGMANEVSGLTALPRPEF